jgi:hypothetical protein
VRVHLLLHVKLHHHLRGPGVCLAITFNTHQPSASCQSRVGACR